MNKQLCQTLPRVVGSHLTWLLPSHLPFTSYSFCSSHTGLHSGRCVLLLSRIFGTLVLPWLVFHSSVFTLSFFLFLLFCSRGGGGVVNPGMLSIYFWLSGQGVTLAVIRGPCGVQAPGPDLGLVHITQLQSAELSL